MEHLQNLHSLLSAPYPDAKLLKCEYIGDALGSSHLFTFSVDGIETQYGYSDAAVSIMFKWLAEYLKAKGDLRRNNLPLVSK